MKKHILLSIMVLTICISLTVNASANNTKLIALTFDDGPFGKFSESLLDGLEERGVKCTFFLVGKNIEYYPEIAKREFEDGHQLGNHSYSHPWFSKLGKRKMIDEISTTKTLLKEITEEDNFYVRVPYGGFTDTVKQTVNAPIIQWSVDCCNGNMNTCEYNMKKNFLSQAHDGAIAILHDTSKKNVDVALYAIDNLLEEGYEFVTVDELFRLRNIDKQNGVVYYNALQSSSETDYDESLLDKHWAYDDIKYVIDEKIMEGDLEGFKPNNYMTRSMAATVLWRMAGSPIEKSKSNSKLSELNTMSYFEDVKVNKWYTIPVNWAKEKGFILGVTDDKFEPNSYITKEQFYTILNRFGKAEIDKFPKDENPKTFRDDIKICTWANPHVLALRDAGFVSKNDRQIFRPKDYITRSEVAELICWYLNMCQKS